jgi:predicted flap endonuclease-1-like 5' DNA nuclease
MIEMTLEKEIKRKKENLKYFYQMAQEALDAKDLEQAIEITAKGLEEGETESEEEWLDGFDAVDSKLKSEKKDKTLNTTISPEDITIIKGVGVAVAEKLKTAGFHTIKAISESTVTQLTDIPGIGQKTAQKILEGAQIIITRKSLNDFPEEIHEEEMPPTPTAEEHKIVTILENPSDKKPKFPWLEDKFKIKRGGYSQDTKVEYEEINDNSEVIEPETELVAHNSFIQNSSTQKQPKQETISNPKSQQLPSKSLSEKYIENSPRQLSVVQEELLPSEKSSVVQRIVNTLQELDFHIVEKVRLLKDLSMNLV